MKHALFVVAVTFILLSAATFSQDKVKYCKNATTGEIITVGIRSPCPFPTHAI